ncbi:MAG TPA: methyltransferase domain-containing protein [Longimicrobiaceae bacterium]|jgi:cyclopropane fatty-acyl-phospholipid synthase-like methyltransferase|nr:methyltransferase domain-containing protein [Longimicrobiaceae bacterium]
MTAPSDWWADYFDEKFVDLYRHFLTNERTEREVAGIREMLSLAPGAEVLDLACGWGRHSIELAEAGFRVTGLDFSPTLLASARKRAKAAGVTVDFVKGDMREVPWTGRFDAVLSLFSSLGYFLSDEEDLRVLRSAHDALKPAGLFLMETMHRDHIVGAFAERDWWENEDGTTVWIEREFDAVDGVSREWLRWSRAGKTGEKYHELRIRNATEWDVLLRRAGLEPVEWYGDWENAPFIHTSEDLIVVARRKR